MDNDYISELFEDYLKLVQQHLTSVYRNIYEKKQGKSNNQPPTPVMKPFMFIQHKVKEMIQHESQDKKAANHLIPAIGDTKSVRDISISKRT